MDLIVGIFVGGASSRMGRPKGLLAAPEKPSQNLVERLIGEAQHALSDPKIVLVGERSDYAQIALPVVKDEALDKGPLGGLVALLAHAQDQGATHVLALACDLPFLEASLIRRLVHEAPQAEVHCPLSEGKYQPLSARYAASVLGRFRTSLQEDKLALQPLVRQSDVAAMELSVSETRTLKDWDTPEDAGLT